MLICETQKIQTSSGSYGFIAGLLVFLFALVANASCARPEGPAVPIVETRQRTPLQAAMAAVYIETDCGRTGTGVLVSPTQVITAHHVVNCATYPKLKHTLKIKVVMYEGFATTATYEVVDPGRDLARLRLRDPFPTSPVSIGYATRGGIACAVTAVPERAIRCARVVALSNVKRLYGDIRTNHADLWFGNSGSGVYDGDGRLIGISTRINFCSNEDWEAWLESHTRPAKTCGGSVSSIVDSPVMP